MAKKRSKDQIPQKEPPKEAVRQPITDTIEKNYMPYVMSVIVSRAIPEIDGFKPSHRKLLYTMYKMGLLTGPRTKSANVVGQTMHLNPHGDQAIYETLVRLTRGNESLLHPFIDSKGSFGKQYSSNMRYAASRYTEVKLDPICTELFGGIDKNAVDMIDNYDNTMKEPLLFPTTFPNVLVTPNMGIAVGMASNICPFNLAEVCDGTSALLKDPELPVEKLMDIIKALDFPGGGSIIYDAAQMREIYETGSGSVKIRARYVYDKENNCIEIIQIPYSTTIELILNRLSDMFKDGRLKDVTDFRDEIDLSGFKLTLDLRRGVDPDKLMAKLYRATPLTESFKCNFNILIDGLPHTMGIKQILSEWVRFRMGCLRRELTYELGKKKDKLHLLLGLGKILLDIDKAIRIVRETEKEDDVVPNLMKGFSIDSIQAEFIAEIKLRNLNREYILNRIKEIEALQNEITELEDTIGDDIKVKKLIISQLAEIKKKYGKPRKSQLIYASEIEEPEEEELVENYNVRIIMTREGYFKKITLVSLRGNDEQKFKEGDGIAFSEDTDNRAELIFFTDRAQVYRARVADFDTQKASALGDFLPVKLGMDDGEKPVFMRVQNDYPEKDHMIFVFENGKGVRVPVTSYQTKGNRKKLVAAYSDASPLVGIFYESATFDIMLVSSNYKAIIIQTSLIPEKTTRSSAGVTLMTLNRGAKVTKVTADTTDITGGEEGKSYRKVKIPAAGVLLADKDIDAQQIKF